MGGCFVEAMGMVMGMETVDSSGMGWSGRRLIGWLFVEEMGIEMKMVMEMVMEMEMEMKMKMVMGTVDSSRVEWSGVEEG